MNRGTHSSDEPVYVFVKSSYYSIKKGEINTIKQIILRILGFSEDKNVLKKPKIIVTLVQPEPSAQSTQDWMPEAIRKNDLRTPVSELNERGWKKLVILGVSSISTCEELVKHISDLMNDMNKLSQLKDKE